MREYGKALRHFRFNDLGGIEDGYDPFSSAKARHLCSLGVDAPKDIPGKKHSMIDPLSMLKL